MFAISPVRLESIDRWKKRYHYSKKATDLNPKDLFFGCFLICILAG